MAIYFGTQQVKPSGIQSVYVGTQKVYEKASGEEYFLTFSSPSSFTLAINNATKNWDGTLEYSTNKTTWTTWDGTTTLSSVNNELYLRGISNTKITGTTSSNYKWVLTGTNISCFGNIENLLDYQTVALGNHPTMGNYCYCYMFYGNTSLITAPSLPSQDIAYYCYYYMFGSTSLIIAPSLPATTLAENCYSAMFSSCSNLEALPSLPAKPLRNYCYKQMFYGCTKIKLSSTRTGEYINAYRIPTSGTTTSIINAVQDMFKYTGGTFKSSPTIGTTYYTSNTIV